MSIGHPMSKNIQTSQTKTPVFTGVLVIMTNLIADQPDTFDYSDYLSNVGPYRGKLFRVPTVDCVSTAVLVPL